MKGDVTNSSAYSTRASCSHLTNCSALCVYVCVRACVYPVVGTVSLMTHGHRSSASYCVLLLCFLPLEWSQQSVIVRALVFDSPSRPPATKGHFKHGRRHHLVKLELFPFAILCAFIGFCPLAFVKSPSALMKSYSFLRCFAVGLP